MERSTLQSSPLKFQYSIWTAKAKYKFEMSFKFPLKFSKLRNIGCGNNSKTIKDKQAITINYRTLVAYVTQNSIITSL